MNAIKKITDLWEDKVVSLLPERFSHKEKQQYAALTAVAGLGALVFLWRKYRQNKKNVLSSSEEYPIDLSKLPPGKEHEDKEIIAHVTGRVDRQERRQARKILCEHARRNTLSIKTTGRLQVPPDYLPNNKMLQELRLIDSEEYLQQRIPHLVIELGETKINDQQYNPLKGRTIFVEKEEFVISKAQFLKNDPSPEVARRWPRAGPREHLYWTPGPNSEVRALIITCGGLCPGLNVVVREIVMTLQYNYRVIDIFAAQYGYEGIYSEYYGYEKLYPDKVKDWHNYGGTKIGTSRGGFDLEKILNAIVQNKINQLYIIGGDGTHRGIYAIFQEITKRKLRIGIAGIPKTIDNDIPIIDQSFGYQTAVEEAQRAIESAWVEAHSAEYGVGVVRLMGRDCGWVALAASDAARNVNVCLVPEFKFELYGDKGVLEYCYRRLLEKHDLLNPNDRKGRHKSVVVVLAEGAADACLDLKIDPKGVDSSGNKLYSDIGKAFSDELIKYCKEETRPKPIKITLKYIDPSYMVRSVKPNAFDAGYCAYTAQNAVHGIMAGFTGFTNGLVCGKNAFIPLQDLIMESSSKKIPQDHRLWRRFLLSSGQPNFLNNSNGNNYVTSSQ